MRKMRSFLGVLASLFIVFLSANAFAGYDCDDLKHYTTCNSGYYLTSNSARNSCAACNNAQNTTSTSESLANGTKTKTCSGNYTDGNGGSDVGAAASCTGCSKYTYTCECNEGYTEINPDSETCSCQAQTKTCSNGQYYDGSSCKTCPAGSWCDPNCSYTYGSNSEQCKHSCPSPYTSSSSGATSQSACYTNCTTSDVSNSTSVSGTKYYNGGTSNCKATGCASGYDLDNGSCVPHVDTSKSCPNGQYLKSDGNCTQCLNGWYCPGGRYPLNSGDQGINQCPDGATGSAMPRNALGNCYKTCETKTDPNGTIQPTTENVSPQDSRTWQQCKYNITCNNGYKAVGDGGTDPSCQQCDANSFCTNNQQQSCDRDYPYSPAGATSQNQCYRNCKASDIDHAKSVSGTLTYPGTDTSTCTVTECLSNYFPTSDKKSCIKCPEHSKNCNGQDDDWDCEDGYTKQDNQCVADGNSWHVDYNYNCNGSHSTCEHVYFGPETAKADITCRPTCDGQVFVGWFTTIDDGTQVTCVTGMETGGEQSCYKWQSNLTLYAHWTAATEQCKSGMYYNGSSHVSCSGKTDSYCPGTGTATKGAEGCYTQCPDGFRDGVDSPYTAETNCYHNCPQKSDDNANSVTAQHNKINYTGYGMTPNCTYTANCKPGFKPQNQNSANASCVKCETSEYCPGGTDDPEECPPGYTCDPNQTECPLNYYCENGQKHECPDNGKTDGTGKSKITDCYKECDIKQTSDIPHSTKVTADNNGKAFHSGSSYPACTYTVECETSGDVKYTPRDNGTATPSCVWNSEGGCPEGYYCPPGQEPQQCPDGGHTDPGATKITDCYKNVDPYKDWVHGTGSATCHYSETSLQYNSNCDDGEAKTCEAGYYYGTPGSLTCESVGDGYYSPADDIERKECPAGGSGSTENADSYEDCYKICTLTVQNATSVTPVSERVNANSESSYTECKFTVVCNTGYTVSGDGTANPTCQANQFTVTLNKNGGSGNVSDSVKCTYGQNCDLPDPSPLSRTGYTNANKWCSDASGKEPCYQAGSVAAATLSATGSDMTLYAAWTPNIYAVNLDDKNTDDTSGKHSQPNKVWLKFATGWFSNQEATTSITQLTQLPTRNGYNFTGFNTAESGGTQVINNVGTFITGDTALTAISTDNATIYAQWAEGKTTCDAGKYYDNTPECKQCPENHYCPGGEFGTGGGDQGSYECPNGGTAPAGSTSADACYKTVDYSASHGSGTQTCYYDSSAQQYNKSCKDQKIDKCHAGYYLTDNAQTDCSEVGNDYYSPVDDTTRHQCPNAGKTHGTTEDSIYDCYKNVPYTAKFGSGTQDCYYTSGTDTGAVFATNCENKHIDKCWAGYYRQNEQDSDCTIVEKNYYSEKDDVERHDCPDKGETEGPGTGEKTLCRLDHLPYNKENGKCQHCSGYQRCYYNPRDNAYTDQCNTPTIEQCDAGYWFSKPYPTDCTEVGLGYWSPDADLTRHQCVAPGTTLTTTSSSASDCYNENTECHIDHGTGKNKCNWGTNAYDQLCTPCLITGCDAGYAVSNGKCEECPEGFFCGGGEPGEGGGKEQCPSEYPHTLPGASSKNDCFKDCPMGSNASAMTGGVYYDKRNTCQITKCAKGYTLQNGVCVLCPAGSFCDGTGGGDGGDDVKSCESLGNAYNDPLTKWEHSDQGADADTDCYAKCEPYSVKYGTALPDSSIVHYPQKCTYHGESETGNPCDIKGEGQSAECVENSCKGNYEMIDGKCTLCQRDHALTYRAEGNCLIASCEAGYHSAETSCVEDVVECEAPNATSAEQTWDRQTRAFSKCTIKVCDEGYHLASNACVPNEQTCTLDHGHGYMEWDIKKNAWGDCIATHCDPGYTNDPSMNYEPNKQCGHCKNKFAQLGELAVDGYKKGEQVVSSYTTECEIAACMYQGELYDLQGNECIPICTPYTDATGTRKRVGNECERTCNDGYMSW